MGYLLEAILSIVTILIAESFLCETMEVSKFDMINFKSAIYSIRH